MNFHRKQILVGAALLMALPSLAFASSSRLEGMSLPGDYTKDYTAFYSWPACITDVGNLVYGELGDANSAVGLQRAMGAVLPNLWDGRFGVWSLNVRERQYQVGQASNSSQPGRGALGLDPNSNSNQSFDLNWGKKFGTNSFGLQFNRSHYELTDELSGTTTTLASGIGAYPPTPWPAAGGSPLARNITGFGAGLSFEMSSKTTTEVSALFQSRTYEASVTGGSKFEDNGGSNYILGGRAMWKWQPNVVVVPVVKYYSFDLGQKATVAGVTTTSDNTLTGWQAGLAGNWAIGSNDLFVLGGTFAGNTLDQENDVLGVIAAVNAASPGAGNDFNGAAKAKITESLAPEVFMALETQINSWLTIRFGANKGVMNNLKVVGTTGGGAAQTLKVKGSTFSMKTGASVKVGSLMFDAVLDDQFFHNPIAQAMGGSNAEFANGAGTMAGKVTATYNW
jgi:hypothetical protein